jgi:predicted transcriptional regulator
MKTKVNGAKTLNKKYNAAQMTKDIWLKRQQLGSNGEALGVRDAAKVAGIDYGALYRMEAGNESPTLSNLVAVCNWLGKTVQHYF